MKDEEYDVVLDVLQKHYDTLVKMDCNEYSDGIMTQIRLEQRDQLQKAIKIWKSYSND